VRSVTILGVPMDLGAGRRGVDMGTSAIRYAGLEEALRALGLAVKDEGDLEVHHAGRAQMGENPKLRYLDEVARVMGVLRERVAAIVTSGDFPLILGGDHSIGIGVLAGLQTAVKSVGVLWFDAHGDYNTDETTPSGNIHGMPLAVAAGHGSRDLRRTWGEAPLIPEEHLALIGAREIDPAEREALRRSKVRVATMTDIDEKGIRRIMEETLDAFSACEHVHVSFDMDSVDPKEAPGVGTSHPGGLTYREAHLAMEMVAASGRLGSLALVEVNPILDIQNMTAKLAAELGASALGQTIL